MVVSPAALAAEPQQQFVAPRLVVNSSFLNVRSGPGVQYSVLLTVVGGTELPVLGRASDDVWFQVSTIVGVGWVNVQFTVPRGSFDNVPVIQVSEFVSTIAQTAPITLGLPDGQGGGGAEIAAAQAPVSGTVRVNISNNRVITVSLNERFRAVINVEAVNLRTQPADNATSLGTLFREPAMDFSIVGSVTDKNGVQWIAVESADLGVGWIEAAKVIYRLSRATGTVVQVTANLTQLLDAPSGSGTNLPILTEGQEGFLRDISKDSNFVKIELGDGLMGWVPFNSVVTRTGTPTDEVDFTQLSGGVAIVPSGAISATAVPGGVPASFGLDTPHVVVNTGFLNIRSGPGSQYSIVATVPGGTELPVLGIYFDGVWYLVQGPFGQGWINIEFAVFRGSVQSLPIIQSAAGTLSSPVAVIAQGGTVTLYAAPGGNFGAIGALTGPLEADVVARTVDSLWLQLNTSLGFGWVLASQVVLRGDASTIPVVG
jgi:uncharacterized protein YraI